MIAMMVVKEGAEEGVFVLIGNFSHNLLLVV